MSTANLFQMTDHHCDPKTNGHGLKHNRVLVWRGIHEAWHIVFLVKSPDEVLEELVGFWLVGQGVRRVYARTRYWGGSVQPLMPRYHNSPKKLRAFNLVFPTERPLEILKLWAWRWIPKDYLEELSVDIGDDRFSITPDTPDNDLIAKIERRQECKLLEAQAANGHSV